LIYLIGSLRNPKVTELGRRLRADGYEVFDQWYASGPEADDKWKEYEVSCGHTFEEALAQDFARTVFEFDLSHIKASDTVVLVCPAGKSGHLEFGWAVRDGKKGYILLDPQVDRWDMMYQFAHRVLRTPEELITQLRRDDEERL
jgi:hypothetical protein